MNPSHLFKRSSILCHFFTLNTSWAKMAMKVSSLLMSSSRRGIGRLPKRAGFSCRRRINVCRKGSFHLMCDVPQGKAGQKVGPLTFIMWSHHLTIYILVNCNITLHLRTVLRSQQLCCLHCSTEYGVSTLTAYECVYTHALYFFREEKGMLTRLLL